MALQFYIKIYHLHQYSKGALKSVVILNIQFYLKGPKILTDILKLIITDNAFS